jgi:hypothetical protein
MLVEIIMATGRSCWILTGTSKPIGYIKFKIQQQEGVASDFLTLVFARKLLKDKRTVSYYKIRNGSRIYHVIRCRGGGGGSACHGDLTVNLPSGHSIDVPLDDVDTIYQLKLWVQNSEGISVNRQIMMFGKRELMDFVRISDCEIMDFDLLLRDVQIGLPQPATENPPKLWNPSTLEKEISYRYGDETQTQKNHTRKNRRNAEVPVPVPIIEEDIVVLPASSKSYRGHPNMNSKAV